MIKKAGVYLLIFCILFSTAIAGEDYQIEKPYGEISEAKGSYDANNYIYDLYGRLVGTIEESVSSESRDKKTYNVRLYTYDTFGKIEGERVVSYDSADPTDAEELKKEISEMDEEAFTNFYNAIKGTAASDIVLVRRVFGTEIDPESVEDFETVTPVARGVRVYTEDEHDLPEGDAEVDPRILHEYQEYDNYGLPEQEHEEKTEGDITIGGITKTTEEWRGGERSIVRNSISNRFANGVKNGISRRRTSTRLRRQEPLTRQQGECREGERCEPEARTAPATRQQGECREGERCEPEARTAPATRQQGECREGERCEPEARTVPGERCEGEQCKRAVQIDKTKPFGTKGTSTLTREARIEIPPPKVSEHRSSTEQDEDFEMRTGARDPHKKDKKIKRNSISSRFNKGVKNGESRRRTSTRLRRQAPTKRVPRPIR
jgi:hypothetical protein